MVLVRGEAGVGKSALVREFIDAHADDAHIYFGSCDDLLTPEPLGPLRDIARDDPRLVAPLADGDRSAVLATSLDLLTGSLRPNIMVFEDTQWADEATLDVIKYLGRRISRANGLLLLTYRDGEVDYDHPLRLVIGELAPENIKRIRLHGLSADAVSDLVGDADLDVGKILALTDGNPLFVTEVLRSGVESVPSSVQDSVLARAAKLSPSARQVLDLVSIVPGEAARPLIDTILGPSEEHVTECARQGLLRVETDTVSFHHELTRHAVETALSPADRRRLNAEVLAETREQGDLAQLVHHAVGANDVDAIIEYAPKAARAAMAIQSHREAATQFRVLEPYLDRIAESDRADIVYDWARIEFYVDNTQSNAILNKAIALYRSSGNELGLARALIFAVRTNELSGHPQAADESAAEAMTILESYPPSQGVALAVSNLAWLSLMRGTAGCVEMADRAIDLARAGGDELALIHALNSKGYVEYMQGDPTGLQLLEEARERAARAGNQFEEIRALINMMAAAAGRRELDLAVDSARRAHDTAVQHEYWGFQAYANIEYSTTLLWKGEWARAEDLATQALGSLPQTNLHALQVLGSLQSRQGRPEAGTTLERAWSRAERTTEMEHMLPVAAAHVEYLWLRGEKDEDRITRFRKLLGDALRSDFHTWDIGDLAFWLWEVDEITEAPKGIPKPYRLVIEGKPAEAAAIWNKKGFPYERALALMHGGDQSRLEALEVFETLGADAVAAKLRKALRDDGVAVPRGKSRHTRGHPADLTARQAEVLELLGEGLSNIEIADRLFVSPRTVENHVSAVLTKLDSSTRMEAVSRAREEGVLPADV